MHIYKRGRIWWLEYEAGGKRYRQSCRTTRRDAAAAFANSIKAAARMPTFDDAVEVLRRLYNRPATAIPIAGAWETYITVARSIGRDTISAYQLRRRQNCLTAFVAWLRRARPLVESVEAVTPPVAAGYAAELAARGLKTKTRRNIIGELSAIWRILEKAAAELRNPWGSLAPADVDGERGRAFTPAETEALLAAARRVGKNWHAVCTVALHTGLRYGDVARLKWAAVDGGTIRVAPGKTARFGIATAFPITPPVAAALAETPRCGEYVFPAHAALYGRHGARALAFSEVLEAAGLGGRGYTFHSLRHTAATRLAAAGVGVETRKRILGHTVDATTERYDHDEHLAEVRAAMEAADAAAKKSPAIISRASLGGARG